MECAPRRRHELASVSWDLTWVNPRYDWHGGKAAARQLSAGRNAFSVR
jgi:hypothetical protein